MAKIKMAKNQTTNKKLKVAVESKQKPQSQQTLKQQKKQKQKKRFKSKSKSKSKTPIHQQDEDPILFGSGSGSGSESDSPLASPTRIQSLLEPYTKPQLVAFLLDAAPSDPDLRARIRSHADSDVSHRQIFVYGLGWDATMDDLAAAFATFGPIEGCSVVVDKNTGRAKGYGFVLFKSRAAAARALREPQKRIGNRMASCQLATAGGVKPDSGRKIYISNVRPETSPEKLREFFAKFGEIESGPFGFDAVTGKSKGYAIFVYKSLEEAKKALEEPYKVFEGQQLHCKIASLVAAEAPKTPVLPLAPVQAAVPAVATVAPVYLQQQHQQSMLAAVAAAQNLALFGQNPAHASLLVQNPLMAVAVLNPGIASSFGGGLTNAAALGGVVGMPYAGGAQSVPGAYSAGQGMSAVGLQGLQGYQTGSSSQAGQMSSGNARGTLGGFVYDVMKQNR